MKAKLIGKNSVQVTMTLRQAESMDALVDSVMEHMSYTESKSYNDAIKAGEAFMTAVYRAKTKGKNN
jgi:hypothetical protein